MSITILKIGGTTEIIEPTPGVTCKDAMVDKGIYDGPLDSFRVLCDNECVDQQPLDRFDGKKLVLAPVEEKGGCRLLGL